MRLIRVMCSGRVDLGFVLRAFSNGMDGVFVGGCRLNECNYVTQGNYDALSMVHLCRKIMGHIGLNPERLSIEFMSAGEGTLFAEAVNEFVEKVNQLGPLGKGEGMDEKELKFKLEAATRLVPYIKLVERERLRVPVKSKEAYDEFFSSQEIDSLLNELVLEKLSISEIVSLLRERPSSTGEVADKLGLSPSEISRHIKNASRQGLVRYDESLKRFALA